ncbi:MAG: hypothetical protein WKG07_17670 [Hymenobacter sp.]
MTGGWRAWKAARPTGKLPAVCWLSYNVHGNEAVSQRGRACRCCTTWLTRRTRKCRAG